MDASASSAGPSTSGPPAQATSAGEPASLQAPAASAPAPTADSSTASTSATSASAGPSIKVWKPTAGAAPPRIPDLPDSYYNPTAGELRAAHAGQTNRLRALGVDTQFTTKAQREKEAREREQKRANRFPRAIIRVRFADRHQIETEFPSTRTIQAVYDFVKSALADEAKNEPFTLYSPPRYDLKPSDPKVQGKSLLDLQLAPSSILYIRFAKDSLNDPSKLAPISSSLLATSQDLPVPPSFDPTPEQLAASAKSTGDSETGEKEKMGKTLGGGAKVPKWLQKVAPNSEAHAAICRQALTGISRKVMRFYDLTPP